MDIITAIQQIRPIDSSIQIAILDVVKRRVLPKGAVLLNEGEIAEEVHFIEEGLVRGFYYDGERDITSWIISDGRFIWPLPSYLLRRPSRENIQLLERTTVISISRQDVDELTRQYGVFENLKCLIMERYIILYDKRVQMLLMKSEDRLEAYQELFPDLYRRVSQRHIATYLGIDPSTLSRLRGNYRN